MGFSEEGIGNNVTFLKGRKNWSFVKRESGKNCGFLIRESGGKCEFLKKRGKEGVCLLSRYFPFVCGVSRYCTESPAVPRAQPFFQIL